jgi:predicted CoA-binding protein
MSTVAVIGASANPDRIAYQALGRLLDHHHEVIPVNPSGGKLLGQTVKRRIGEIDQTVDTVTLYLAARHQGQLGDELIALAPRRIIFNPGAENPPLYARLRAAGIEVEEACTLVLLATGQF